MHRLALIIALLASLGTAYANDTLYAVVEYGSAGNPLIPIDSTSEATLNGTLLAWQKCSRIRALDIQFRPLDLRLEEVEEPEALLGQVLLHFGALNVKTKELLGLVSSLVLRCDDCVRYHLIKCFENGVTGEELFETLAIANLVGGTIVIPHTRRAVEFWDELTNEETK